MDPTYTKAIAVFRAAAEARTRTREAFAEAEHTYRLAAEMVAGLAGIDLNDPDYKPLPYVRGMDR